MITPDKVQQWRTLHLASTSANNLADRIEREMTTALRLCIEGKAATFPTELLDTLARARQSATAARIAADLYVEKQLLVVLPPG